MRGVPAFAAGLVAVLLALAPTRSSAPGADDGSGSAQQAEAAAEVQVDPGRAITGTVSFDADDDSHPAWRLWLREGLRRLGGLYPRSPSQTVVSASLPLPLLVDRTELTQQSWSRVVTWDPELTRLFGLPRRPWVTEAPLHPVDALSWCDALRFANLASLRAGLDPVYASDAAAVQATGGLGWVDAYTLGGCEGDAGLSMNLARSGHRLPTSAEWHALAIGPTAERRALPAFGVGSSPGDLRRVGWSSLDAGFLPRRVARKAPSSRGLHDLHGNVAELVVAVAPSMRPQEVRARQHAASRGGTASCIPQDCALGNEAGTDGAGRLGPVGVRLVRTKPEAE